jgi:glycosyltransferase involved in cell wall biosynthesis
MRIAVICGHFIPELGYHEVSLAKALSVLGHEVLVITSDKIPASVRNKEKFESIPLSRNEGLFPYSLFRLRSIISFRSVVIPVRLKKKVKELKPDLIILFGIAKMFPVPVMFSEKLPDIKILSFFGDNEDMKRDGLSEYFKKFYRSLLYKQAIRISDKIAFYTPSTEEIVSRITGYQWFSMYKNKLINTSLGFDSNDFYYDPELRDLSRKELGFTEEDVVIVYSSRVVCGKGLEQIIETVDSCISEGKKLKMIIIGLFNDRYGLYIRKIISNSKNSGCYHLYGFLNHQEVNKYFNCADAGIWGQASISIQQAMGTGLFVLLPERKNVSHLLTQNQNGAFYNDIPSLKKRIIILTNGNKREDRLLLNQKFNNLNLCKDVLGNIAMV